MCRISPKQNFVTCWFFRYVPFTACKIYLKDQLCFIFCVFCIVLKGQCISKPCPNKWITTWLSTVFEAHCISFATDFTQTTSQKPRTTSNQPFANLDHSFYHQRASHISEKILSRGWILRCSLHIVVNVQHISQRAILHVYENQVLPCQRRPV